jgi:hypothetical protein
VVYVGSAGVTRGRRWVAWSGGGGGGERVGEVV